MGATISIDEARAAVAAGDWRRAYDAYRAADPGSLTGRDLEDLADAAWWVSELAESLDHRHKAYAAFEVEGDEPGAGRTAARIAIEHFLRDEPAIGAGFLMRAHRHAESFAPDGVEHGWLAAIDGSVARFGGEPDRSIELMSVAIDAGRRHGDRDLVALAIHIQGLAMIDAGRIREGLALLDEAMAAVVAGEVGSYFTGIIYCAVIAICLELGDIRRAGEWSDAARVWCESLPHDSPFPAMCRVSRAEVAALRGSWSEAEAEAERAESELMAIEPGLAGWALAQVGEVRRRLGDLPAAADAFERAQELGADPQPGFALVRLAQRKIAAARSALGLALSDTRSPQKRVRLLSAQVEVAVAAGEVDEARSAAAELAALAETHDLLAFAAAAATADGSIALASGDAPVALAASKRACSAWQELRLPYETARARVQLGRAMLASGDEDGSRVEIRGALATFERLGASADVAAANALLGPGDLPAGLTAREAEVLRLVAAGKTNRDIAVELVISEHTVARHLQNMFAKLGVSSRAAATAYAFEHELA
jgi:ATP/maltotriose-dependent transcriptional regulator MalT